jgi:D-serine deaminase-like pyridoxal phosphate-dependent protein
MLREQPVLPPVDPGAGTLPAPVLPERLDTPCVLVDLDVLEANLAAMAAELGRREIALRPHAKTHSASALAHRQIAGGACGVTAGTLGMAEALVRAGIDDVFVANAVWAAGGKAERLRALHDACALAVGCDSHEGAVALAEAVAGARRRLRVVIEIDSGDHRAGVSPDRVAALARGAARAGLDVIGAFTHGGHGYARPGAADGAAMDEVLALAHAARELTEAGFEPEVLSAGSTPTVLRSARPPVNEERPGTYVFNDRQQLALGGAEPEQLALFAAATVVSTAVPGQVVLDAGAKTLGRDRPDWLAGYGALPAHPQATVEQVFDYHAVVHVPVGTPSPRLGDVVAVVPNHACAVAHLSDELLAVRDGAVAERWPVDLRARS